MLLGRPCLYHSHCDKGETILTQFCPNRMQTSYSRACFCLFKTSIPSLTGAVKSVWVVRLGQRLSEQRTLDQEAGEGEGAGDRGKDARSITFNLYSLRVKANEAPELRFFIV